MAKIAAASNIEVNSEMIAAGTRALMLYDDRFSSPEEAVENILRKVFDANSRKRYFLSLTADALAMR